MINFGSIVDNLDLYNWKDKTSPANMSNKINDIIKNHQKHSSISNIKQNMQVNSTSFC